MPTQMHLPVQPARAEAINAVLAIVREGDEVAYFASGVPVFVHAKDDAAGQRLAAVQMMELGLARQDELSAALEVNRTTRCTARAARSRPRAYWGWWMASAGRGVRIGLTPKSVSRRKDCWRRVCRSGRRQSAWVWTRRRCAWRCAGVS